MGVIDINSRTRYAGKGRPGSSPPGGADAGLLSGRRDSFEVGIGSSRFSITDQLGAQLRDLNEAVRDGDAGVPQGRPEGGAVSHVAAMLQKMRIASNEEHDRAYGQTKREDGMEWAAAPDRDPAPMTPAVSDDREAPSPIWRSSDLVPLVTTPTVGYPMRKDIALGALETCGDVNEMRGRQIVINIQGVSFSCRISQEVVDAVKSGLVLSSVLGAAFQTAIRNYALKANGDVVDAAFDGCVLNIRYVGDATKPLLVSAFIEACPSGDSWSMQIDMTGDRSLSLCVVAAPIDAVVAAFSKSCMAVDRRPFLNDNSFDVVVEEQATSGAPAALDYSAATSESDKRRIIEKAAMAMIRKAKLSKAIDQ